MNQTMKAAKNLQRGDMIRPHIDSATLTVRSVEPISGGMVRVFYRWNGEGSTLDYRAETLITVIED
jgi:hypothetical protein